MIENASLEVLMKKIGNRYGLVLAAAARANELAAGQPPLIQTKSKKATTVALEEVAKDKIHLQYRKEKKS